ncbi:MAG: SRPBCC family protein [Chitinophagales bacterium]
MPLISLITEINAPIERCFQLATSIDLHMVSTETTGEKAIAGRTQGLILLNETVTWRAKHLGVWQTLTSRITAYNYPTFFTDEMVQGAFKSIVHHHRFAKAGDKTIMEDEFYFESPLGLAGRLFNRLFLTSYLKRLLQHRNAIIKQYAESDEWKKILLPA